MPDAMDRVQQMTDAHHDDAIKQHTQRPKAVGLSHCERSDCRAEISEPRQEMGARLCLVCQREEEARASHFRKWGQR